MGRTKMLRGKLRSFLNDSILSIAGLVIMNVAAQFAVYPAWNQYLGAEINGEVLYLISILNIYAISMGSACNYARMTREAVRKQDNSDYNLYMVAATAVAVALSPLVPYLTSMPMDGVDVTLFALLCVLTMWRYYADVEYRMSLNYRGCFCYYLIIGVGYLVGIELFRLTGRWALALIPGEAAGVAVVALRGKVLRGGIKPTKEFRAALSLMLMLTGTDILSNLIFNGDRLLLNVMVDGVAVTIYYLASLLGKTMSLITTPLNSVIIGYLTRYDGGLDRKLMHIITGISAVACVLATAACTVASHILIPWLYPAEYDLAKEYFITANLAQVFYFIGNVITVVLLRFSKARYQLYINIVYAAAFLLICPVAAHLYGINGFCWGLMATCILRLGYSLLLGYKAADHKPECGIEHHR